MRLPSSILSSSSGGNKAFNRSVGLGVIAAAASVGLLLLLIPSGASARVRRLESSASTPPTTQRTMFGRKKEAKPEKTADVYDGGPDDEERELSSFMNRENMEVGYRVWRPKKGSGGTSKGLIFIVHGMHEHGGRYADNAHWFVKRGYTVCASDHEGHGRSYGDRAFLSDWQHLVSDTVQFMKKMVDQYQTDNDIKGSSRSGGASPAPPAVPSTPIFVLGHSMGSLVTAMSLVTLSTDEEDGGKYKNAISAVVFSGCPLVPGPAAASPLGLRCLYGLTKAPRLLMSLAKTFASVDPHGPNAPIDENCLSADPSVLERIHRDSLHFEGRVKNKSAFEFIKMAGAVRENASKIALPAFVFHGDLDEIAYPEGSRQLLSLLGSEEKEAVFYPGLMHEVLNEPSWTSTCEAILVFFQKHSP